MDKVIQSHMSLNTSDDDKETQSLKQNKMNHTNGNNSKSMVDLNQGLVTLYDSNIKLQKSILVYEP